MRRIDVLAFLTMLAMAVAWLPGCPRNDLIDQGAVEPPPQQVQEAEQPTPPADTTPPASASKAATPPMGNP